MFTGIVTDVGEIVSIVPGGQKGDRRFVIRTRHDPVNSLAATTAYTCLSSSSAVKKEGISNRSSRIPLSILSQWK